MINRNDIVKNGCSGSCCENFFFPLTMSDLTKMKDEWERHGGDPSKLEKVLCDDGHYQYPDTEDSVYKLLDMLIHLGETEIDPQYGNNITQAYIDAGCKKEDGTWDKERFHIGVMDRGDKVVVNTYTCKHFDTANRVCNNYENRPYMCRNFGTEGKHECKYKGCNFKSTEPKF